MQKKRILTYLAAGATFFGGSVLGYCFGFRHAVDAFDNKVSEYAQSAPTTLDPSPDPVFEPF